MRLCVCVCVCSFICIYLYVCVCVCVWCSRRKVKQEGSFRLCLSNRHIFNQSRLVWSNWCYCCDHHLFCCLRSNANPQSNCQSNSEWDRSSLLRNNPQDWDWLFLSFLLRSFPPPPTTTTTTLLAHLECCWIVPPNPAVRIDPTGWMETINSTQWNEMKSNRLIESLDFLSKLAIETQRKERRDDERLR